MRGKEGWQELGQIGLDRQGNDVTGVHFVRLGVDFEIHEGMPGRIVAVASVEIQIHRLLSPVHPIKFVEFRPLNLVSSASLDYSIGTAMNRALGLVVDCLGQRKYGISIPRLRLPAGCRGAGDARSGSKII